jgi:transcriptional regulator NrdR family protein
MPKARKTADKAAGIPCPACGSCLSVVLYRRAPRGFLRRRRRCLNPACGARFTTAERVVVIAADSIDVTKIVESVRLSRFTSGTTPERQ